MKRLFAVVLGVAVFGVAGFSPAADDDNAKKLVGTWEITKSGSDLPAGSVIEFTKDGKLNVTLKLDGKDEKIAGTYKVQKEQLMVTLKAGEETIDETVTIKKLTDDALVIEDKDKKVDEFKKKK